MSIALPSNKEEIRAIIQEALNGTLQVCHAAINIVRRDRIVKAITDNQDLLQGDFGQRFFYEASLLISKEEVDQINEIAKLSPKTIQMLLTRSVKRRNKELVIWCLSKGADPKYTGTKETEEEESVKLKKGYSYFHELCAAYHPSNISIARILYANGANVNAKDNKGNTPLHFSAASVDLDLIKFLVEAGSSLELENEDFETPYDRALRFSLSRNVKDYFSGLKSVSLSKGFYTEDDLV